VLRVALRTIQIIAEDSMATRRQQNEAYKAALNLLGRDLARRAKSRCELSGASGSLTTVDLAPGEPDPHLGRVVLVTPELAEALGGGVIEPGQLRFLEDVVWSTDAPIRGAAVALLERIDEGWARDAIDNARVMDASADDA
jgi:protein PhnA